MINSKKGVYFTLVSIIIITLMISHSNFVDNSRIKQKGQILSMRADNMNNLLTDIEKDIERMILISGYRSILSVEKYLSDSEDFLDDFNDVFSSLFIYGSYNSTSYSLMDDASLLEWRDRIQEETSVLGLDFNIVPNKVWAEHIDPWTIIIYVNVTILLQDIDIEWNYTKIFSNNIPIVDLEDPLYKINSLDKVTNLITKSTITDFIDDLTNDTINFEIHLNNSYYIESNSSPSFLMRFEGNLSNSTYGIESFVDLEEFNKQSLTVYNRSLIDYIYFSNDTDADYCNFENLPEWFKVDSDHLNKYELNKINYASC